jgi:hypothetical protein
MSNFFLHKTQYVERVCSHTIELETSVDVSQDTTFVTFRSTDKGYGLNFMATYSFLRISRQE